METCATIYMHYEPVIGSVFSCVLFFVFLRCYTGTILPLLTVVSLSLKRLSVVCEVTHRSNNTNVFDSAASRVKSKLLKRSSLYKEVR